MSKLPEEYLRHILDETDFLIRSHAKTDRDDFLTDEVLKRAWVRSLEIIGEATKKLPDQFTRSNPGIDWRSIAGTRDKLIHDYFGVDYHIVWDIVVVEIPHLRSVIRDLLSAG